MPSPPNQKFLATALGGGVEAEAGGDTMPGLM